MQNHPDSGKLAELLHSTAIRLLRSLRRLDEASGLTASRLSALSVIVFSGQVTLGELAEAELVRPPTMTRIVSALEEQQLVVKMQDQNDGRLIQIRATTKGKRLLLQGRARRVHHLDEQIRRLNKVERERLSAALHTIQKLPDRLS